MATLIRKQQLVPIFWGLCLIESIIAIVYLLLLPADPKNIVFAGYSWARLLIVAFMLVIVILIAWFMMANIRRPGSGNLLPSLYRLELAEGWIFLASLLSILFCLVLLIATPPFLRGARIERLAPILIWLCLCSMQVAIILLAYSREKIAINIIKLHKFLEQANYNQGIGYLLILISLIIGLITIFYTYYNSGDEGDTYAVGWLVSKGYILYKDVFSHHFPFPYLWIGLISRIFGPSITIYRISLLLLRIGLFIGTLRLSRYPLIIGFTSISWSLIGPLFLGNLLLYYSFSGIFIVCSAIIVLADLRKDAFFSIKQSIFVGVLIGLAGLTDPVMLLPGAFVAFFLAIAGYRTAIELKQKIVFFLSPFFFASLIFLLYFGYLLATSSLLSFIQSAILFNTQIYSRYSGQTYTILGLLKAVFSGLNLFDPSIRIYISPYFYWESYNGLNNWAFTALFFRLAIILTSLTFLLRKKYIAGTVMYFVGAVLFYRGVTFFHGMLFNFFALAVASFSVIEFLSTIFVFFKINPISSFKEKLVNSTVLLLTSVISLMFLILNIRAVEFWVQNRADLSYSSQFGHIINDSAYLKQFGCGYENTTLLVYPGNPGMYFFSQLLPSSPYLFMTPWVAEVGQQEVIAELNGEAAIVYIDKELSVWNYPVRDYLSSLISFLDREYIEVDDNVYISPFLEQYCLSKQ